MSYLDQELGVDVLALGRGAVLVANAAAAGRKINALQSHLIQTKPHIHLV